jgi:hypothetical protein
MEPKLLKGTFLLSIPKKDFTNGIAVVRHDAGYKIKDRQDHLKAPLVSDANESELQ